MFYIFHGPDEFSAKEMLAGLQAKLGDPAAAELNMAELDGKTATLNDIVHHANAMPFLSPRRLVIVSEYLTRFGGSSKADHEALKKLQEALNHLPETTDLVFVESTILKAGHPILKLAQTIPQAVKTFAAPTQQNLIGWIENRVKKLGGQIEGQAATALATVVGDDLRALNNEIEKLTLYVNDKRPIRLADTELLCPYTAASENFAMTNAIGRRNAKIALDQLHKRLEEGENPLAIMAGITSQFRGLLEVKSMAAAGLSPAQIAAEKGWKGEYAARMRLQEAQNFSLERLVRTFSVLLEVDLAVKTGEMEQILALDLLISRLCGTT